VRKSLSDYFDVFETNVTPAQLVKARALVLFKGILLNDKKVLKKVLEVQANSAEVLRLGAADDAGDELLVFHLVTLYQLLQLEAELVFSVFRRALYQGNLNEELAALGGQILVHKSVGRIDENIYVLARL